MSVGVWWHGLESVDWEGVEEFVGYYEWCFIFGCVWVSFIFECMDGEESLQDGTKRIFSVHMIGILAYLLVL